jgi:tetratricopeptide (TPR) repeat protein
VALAALTLTAYWPVRSCDFISYDDPVYVTENPHIRPGLTREGLVWAFARLHGEDTYWHPLTWVSHMTDCQLFGLEPMGHHIMNLVVHALNAVILFFLLRRMTGAFWRCAVAAALFALHPIQVDTVAWVAERKNLLSALFWLLTLWAYSNYARPSPASALRARRLPRWSWYAITLILFALGLMCKPVLVTLPFVMLLLDYWPLRRFQQAAGAQPQQGFLRLFTEKAPFLLLAATSSVATIVAHQRLGMLQESVTPSLVLRIQNALVSYVRYLGKFFWPTDLAVYYPYPESWPLLRVAVSGILLLLVTLVVISQFRKRPYLVVGWLWFVGALVPFIGLVHAGMQSMADRFAYVPLVGFLIAIVWLACDFAFSQRLWRPALALAAVVAILAGIASTRSQIACWKSSETLFEHAIKVTDKNDIAHYALGLALERKGRRSEAIQHYREAIRITPTYTDPIESLGCALAAEDDFDGAIAQFRTALQLSPTSLRAHFHLGLALASKGECAEALDHYERVLVLWPDRPEVVENYASALSKVGRTDEAIDHYTRLLLKHPDLWTIRSRLALCLANKGQLDEAAAHFASAIETGEKAGTNPQLLAAAHHQLASILAMRQQPEQALVHWKEAARLDPAWPEPLNNAAWVLATHPNATLRNGPEALSLAQRAAELTASTDSRILDTLACAFAENGRFEEAISTAVQAQALATRLGLTNALRLIEERLALYRSGQPYHEIRTPADKKN